MLYVCILYMLYISIYVICYMLYLYTSYRSVPHVRVGAMCVPGVSSVKRDLINAVAGTRAATAANSKSKVAPKKV